jgi:phage terminase large subunit
MGSMRTSRDDWRPRMYLSTNPGGIGHHWFKSRLVLPARTHKETNTRFIFSTYKDNAFLNSEYIQYLEGLKGHLGRAWRDGDWDVFEGQAFPMWNYDEHVIPAFELPEDWFKWRGIDWGFTAPFSCLWAARDPDSRRIFVYRELYRTGLTVPKQTQFIREYTPPTEKIAITYADPSMWAKKTQSDIITTTADEYAMGGVPLTKADNDRLAGKRKLDALLSLALDGLPGIQIFENCENLIRTLPALTYDPAHPEDVDTEQEDHGFDSLKYLLTNTNQGQKQAPRQQNPWTIIGRRR